MRFDWWTFALQTINFAVLVWLLQRFLYRPVLQLMDTRRTEVQAQYAEAAALESKAKAALEDIEKQRIAIAAERATALRAAAAQAEEAAATKRAEAEHAATTLLDTARKTLSAERAVALTEARRAALDLGTDIALKLLAEMPEESRAEAWLARIEQHLAAMPLAERRELVSESQGEARLAIVTAMPLSEALRLEWGTRLTRLLGDRARMDFAVDAALVAGVELHFREVILRFSWSSALAALRAQMETS